MPVNTHEKINLIHYFWDTDSDDIDVPLTGFTDHFHSVAIDPVWYDVPASSIQEEDTQSAYDTFLKGFGANIAASFSSPIVTSFDLKVGKILSGSITYSDADGTTGADLLTDWYQFDGTDYTFIQTSDAYTVRSEDVGKGIAARFKFTDDLGNEEISPYVVITTGGENLVYTPNTAVNQTRTEVPFSEFASYLSANSILEQPIDFLLGDDFGKVSKWGEGFGNKSSLTYSISQAGQLSFSTDYQQDLSGISGNADLASFYQDLVTESATEAYAAKAFTASELQDIDAAIADWQNLTGISFTKITDSASQPADIVFTKLDFAEWASKNSTVSELAAGFAFLPTNQFEYTIGDVFLDTDFGNPFKQVVVHEIGHALGLSHPHDGRETYTDGTHLPNYNSIMSYGSVNNFLPITPMQMDLDAVKALYGVNANANVGSSTYSENVDTFNVTNAWKVRKMLHDVGGSDTLTFTSASIGNTDTGIFVNLQSGSHSNLFDDTSIDDAASALQYSNFYISDQTEIEGLTTTDGADKINADVTWSTIINAGDGDDEIKSGGANATIDGGAGTDTLILKATDYSHLYVQETSANSGTVKYKSDDALFCTGTDIEFIRLLDGLNKPTSSTVTWSQLEALMPSPMVDTFTPTVGSDTQMFEVAISERYGDIIEFGVKLKNDAGTGTDTSTVDFDSLTLEVSWANGKYTWWEDQFNASTNAPSNPVDGSGVETPDVSSGEYTDYSYHGAEFERSGVDQDVFKIVMVEDAGMTFTENEFVATFMLKKLTTETSSTLTLNKSQYTLHGEASEEMPSSADHTFGFANHAFNAAVSTKGDVRIPNIELLKTDKGTTDGLSIVPVAKSGDLIQYQVVLNIPKPSFIADVPMNPNHLIEISSAGILTDSVQLLTDTTLTTTQTAEIVGGTGYAATVKDAAPTTAVAVTTVETPTSTNYLGQDHFFDLYSHFDEEVTSKKLSTLNITDKMTFEFNNLVKPTATGDTAETRYVLAEFVAISNGGDGSDAIKFKSANQSAQAKTDGTAYSFDAGALRTIERDFDSSGASYSSSLADSLADGSEVVLLGDSLYLNENKYDDAVSAQDALGALRIANMESNSTGTSATSYSKEQIIAADFNQSGVVTAGDAADILSYIVDGAEPGVAVPEWVYVNTSDITGLHGSNVAYDQVLDLFAYEPINLTDAAIANVAGAGELTGILRGDVTDSYGAAHDASTTMGGFAYGISLLYSKGVFDPTATAQTGATGDYAASGGTGAETFTLGANVGVHVISDLEAIDVILLDDSVYNFATSTEYAGTPASGTYTVGTDDPTSAEIVSALDAALTTGSKAVTGLWTASAEETNARAYDINDDGDIDATNDLVIIMIGADEPILLNDLDPFVYLDTL